MRGAITGFFALLGVSLALMACDAGPSAVLTDGEGKSPPVQTEQVETRGAAPESAPGSVPTPEVAPRADVETNGTLTETRYGEWPLWSSNRRYSAYENATYHFEKHAHSFRLQTYPEWVAFVHEFVHNPPKGTQTIKRNNGDTLFYDARQNIFAVMTRQGAPRTLFRPDDGAAYWQKQKEIEARRRTTTRDNRDDA